MGCFKQNSTHVLNIFNSSYLFAQHTYNCKTLHNKDAARSQDLISEIICQLLSNCVSFSSPLKKNPIFLDYFPL